MMTAQAAPWYTFESHGRVPVHGFVPRPTVDGGASLSSSVTAVLSSSTPPDVATGVRFAVRSRGEVAESLTSSPPVLLVKADLSDRRWTDTRFERMRSLVTSRPNNGFGPGMLSERTLYYATSAKGAPPGTRKGTRRD